MVVLAGGIAAERLEFGDHDDKGSADDQKKISECEGGAIESYFAEACSVIRSNEPCFSRLRGRLALEWTEIRQHQKRVVILTPIPVP